MHVDPARPAGRRSPGYGTDKINAAYAIGGAKLTLQDGQAAHCGMPDQPRRQGELRRLPPGGRLLGCVYVDIDRRYFNDNIGLRGDQLRGDRHPARLPEALRPGRARLRPLPPRRQRPRARGAPAGLPAPGQGSRSAPSELISRPREARCGSSRRYTQHRHHAARRSDPAPAQAALVGSAKHPIREVRSRPRQTPGGSNVDDSPTQLAARRVDGFLTPGHRRRRAAATRPARAARRRRRSRKRRATVRDAAPGARRRRTEGEDCVATMPRRRRLPVYYPDVRADAAATPTSPPARALYTIRDAPASAYKAPTGSSVYAGENGQYYGIQGTTWQLAADPRRPERARHGQRPQAR